MKAALRSAAGAAMARRTTKGPAGVLVKYAEEPKEVQHSQRGWCFASLR